MADPRQLAALALVAISLVLVGALITPGLLPLDQRAAVLAAIAGVLLLLALVAGPIRDDLGRNRPYRWPWLRWAFLLWWRVRERDVDDLVHPETTGAKAVPDYPNGKVTGRTPDLVVMTETTESPYVCCGYCSAGMASWTAKQGLGPKMNATAHPIRSQGGRPHDNGSRASELRDGAKRAHGVKLDALAVDEIKGVLRDGFAVVVNLDYADLPDWLKTQGGSFGHSCTLYGWKEGGDDDWVGFFDPLWAQGARGAWARWSAIKPALWADGEHSGTVVRWGVVDPPPDPPDEPEPDDPCPDCPPPELHTRDQLLELADAARLERDRAWRYYTGLPQPRVSGPWSSGTGTGPGVSWSRFARWGPPVEPMTWNGPDTAWDDTSWR